MLKKQLLLGNLFGSINRGERINEAVLLGLILILGVALRFYDLGGESFWLDEVATTIEVQQSIPELLMMRRMDQPPAYYLPLYFWAKLFGISEVALRAFSALAGTGSIILVYLIGRRLFGREVGALSAFFMALSDFQILFSQEARNYSLFEFATLLSFYFLVSFLDSGKKIHFGIYVVFSILMIYINAFGICILAAQNLFYILHIKKRSNNWLGGWIVGQLTVLLVVAPYFSPILFGHGGLESAIATNLSGISTTTFSDVVRSIYRFILPPRRYFGEDMEWGNSLLAIYAFAGLFLVASVLVCALRGEVRIWLTNIRGIVRDLLAVPNVGRNLLLTGCWLFCPPLLLFGISKMIMPVYDHRYVISAAPAFYLLLGLLLLKVRKIVPLWGSLGALMILMIPGLVRYYVLDVREQWKEAAAYVEENGGQNEVVVFAPNDSDVNTANQLKAFNYYYRGALPSCGIGPEDLTDEEVRVILTRCVSDHDRFWVIIRSTALDSRYHVFFLVSNKTAMKPIKEQYFTQLSIYLFEFTK